MKLKISYCFVRSSGSDICYLRGITYTSLGSEHEESKQELQKGANDNSLPIDNFLVAGSCVEENMENDKTGE